MGIVIKACILSLVIALTPVLTFAMNPRIYANYLANELDIQKVRVIKTNDKSYAKPSINRIYINTDNPVFMVLLDIAHEMYHMKQYDDDKHVFDNYIKSKDDYEAYRNQRVEVEARDFASEVWYELFSLHKKIEQRRKR